MDDEFITNTNVLAYRMKLMLIISRPMISYELNENMWGETSQAVLGRDKMTIVHENAERNILMLSFVNPFFKYRTQSFETLGETFIFNIYSKIVSTSLENDCFTQCVLQFVVCWRLAAASM